jgi:hypothetical protein
MTRFVACAGVFLFLAAVAAMPSRSLAQTTISNIDNKPASSWQWCNSCAGGGKTYAVGGVATVTQSGYTVDGSSVRFDLIDNPNNRCSANCYGNVFFWNVLTKNVSETSITDDFYAMMDSAGNSNSQAVEFTVEHDLCKANCGTSSEEDFLYIYSLQCDFKGSGKWRLWDGAANGGTGAWEPTSHACVGFQPNSFNHFVFHFARGNQEVTYIDMWINGVQYSFNNVTYGIEYQTPNRGSQFLASVQLDGDYSEGPYSFWIDKWNITY